MIQTPSFCLKSVFRRCLYFREQKCSRRRRRNGGVMSAEAAPHVRAVAALPWSCLAVFVEIAGGNRVRCYSTIDLVVIINHTGRFARVFAHACAYTTARPHDRTTTTKYRGVSGVCQAASPQNDQQERETQTANRNAPPFCASMMSPTPPAPPCHPARTSEATNLKHPVMIKRHQGQGQQKAKKKLRRAPSPVLSTGHS